MKKLFMLLFACILWNVNIQSEEYKWTKIKNQGTFSSEKLGLSSTGYDRTNNIIYSMKYVNAELIVMAYDVDRDTIYAIPNSGGPQNLRTFTYDHTNDRLIAIRSGRETVYALPATGGEWSIIGNGGNDGESYNAGYFWNEKTNAFGFFSGYGFFSVKNWVWEYQDKWINTIENNSNCSETVPAKRANTLILGKPGDNKVYFASGQGNCSGDQMENSCALGEPWATDVGTYCWLKDVWELDLNTNTFKNLLPVNHESFKREGAITFDYDQKSFVKVGGYIPNAKYERGNDWAKYTDYSMDVTVFSEGSSEGFIPVNVVGDIPPSMKLSQLEHNALFYDGKNKRVIYIRGDGIWTLTKSQKSETKACGYSILENDTVICKGQSIQLTTKKPEDSSCYLIDNNQVHFFLENGAVPNPARFPSAQDAGYIELGTFGQQQVFSISMWVKVPDVQPNTYGVLLDCSHGGSRNWVVQTLDGGKNWSWNDLRFTLQPNVWRHLQFVYHKGKKRIFIDGEKVAENSTPINYSGTPLLTLGNWREGGRRFNGCIDEAYITLEENIYTKDSLPKRINIPSSKAFGLWHFDEGTGDSTMNAVNNSTTRINNWIWNAYTQTPMSVNPVYQWSTGETDSVITVSPMTATTYYLTTIHRGNTFIDSIRVEVSEASVDIFGKTKIHERQVNHSYYTEYHEGSVYQWEVTGNAELASSNGGSSILVNFKDPGFAYIKVTETNKHACVKDTTITVRVYSITDIEEGIMGNVSTMTVFPNPVGNVDAITIRTIMSPGRNGTIELLNILGTQLFSIPTYAQDSYQEYTTQIPIMDLPNGTYMIRYNDGEQTVMEKVLINR